MKYQPTFNNVLIKVKESNSQTPSGLFVASQLIDHLQLGEIVAVGGGYYSEVQDSLIKPPFSVGQQVLVEASAVHEWQIEGEKHLLVNMNQIQVIVTE